MEVTFSALLIASVVGLLLSFLIENIPGFSDRWATFRFKGLTIAGAGVIVTGALVVLSYAGAPVIGIPKPFIWGGLWTSLGVYVAYLMATQTAYQLQAGNLRRKVQPQHEDEPE